MKGRPYRQKDELLKRRILADDVYKKVESILTVRSRGVTAPRGREAPGG